MRAEFDADCRTGTSQSSQASETDLATDPNTRPVRLMARPIGFARSHSMAANFAATSGSFSPLGRIPRTANRTAPNRDAAYQCMADIVRTVDLFEDTRCCLSTRAVACPGSIAPVVNSGSSRLALVIPKAVIWSQSRRHNVVCVASVE